MAATDIFDGVGMRALDQVDVSSSSLARNSLIIAALLALCGSAVGVFAMVHGPMVPAERLLVVCGGMFGTTMLIVLTAIRKVPTQLVALASTVFYALYLLAGLLIAFLSPGNHENALIYLQWFFPLLLLNRMVNSPAVVRLSSHFLMAIPLVTIAVLFRRLLEMSSPTLVYLTLIECLSYALLALMLNAVSRYRAASIAESQRAESLRVQSEVLESISDGFISMDPDFTLTYVNDAACCELGMRREDLLERPIQTINHGFFPESMLAELTGSSSHHASSIHEIQNEAGQWYEMRCFSHPDRISISFRNITKVVLAREELGAVWERVRQQSELLDKAQDAIFVQDLNRQILYWNKGAETLFGWSAAEALGRSAHDLYEVDDERIRMAFDVMLRDGDWSGELQKKKWDGTTIIVESKVKLLRDDQGNPQAILTINTDITARKRAEDRIHRLAFYDHLTGLPNRVLLVEQLERIITRTAESRRHAALLLIDLDDFKTLNDTAGHEAGDELLQEIAIRLRTCLRKSDSIARLGGDEFVVILEGLSENEEVAAAETRSVSEKVLDACRQPYVTPQCVFESTASLGVALFLPGAATVDDLLKRADLAMYQAKAQGRNAICFFDRRMETSASARAVLLADMRSAIQNQEFELHYQPQLDDVLGITGCEALLRWRHPQRGMIPPAEFIPLAESSGLIVDLGSAVLKSACSQLARWATQPHMSHLELSVNVSPRQFLDRDFERLVATALADSGAHPSRLKLEITESVMVQNIEATLSTMTALKALGLSLSLDDFGTGYSSLSQLKRLPLDQIKIDQSFVRDVLQGKTDASIVRTIIGLARNLGLDVIAEGVETPPQREFLEQHGCHAFQGYLFSPALPASELEKFVCEFPMEPMQSECAS